MKATTTFVIIRILMGKEHMLRGKEVDPATMTIIHKKFWEKTKRRKIDFF